jgi:RNA polymerase sigma factor (sigma-70 family)
MICLIYPVEFNAFALAVLRGETMRKVFEDAIGGAPAAQKEIVRLIRQLSRAACARRGPATADVDWEDVAQDACRRFFASGLRQFRKSGSERSFLYAIVRSSVIQIVRSEARRRVREVTSLQPTVVLPHNPIPKFDVTKILSRLSEECRTLLTRVFLRGEPYSSLARELGILDSSVRTKVTRCLRRARQTIEEGGSL